ncbi:MAG: hypothetical protein R6W83_05800 [Cryobacterium sp.]
MRKFIFNSAMIGAVAGGWNALQATRNGPRDWRLVLVWSGWLVSTVVAVVAVLDEARDRRDAS